MFASQEWVKDLMKKVLNNDKTKEKLNTYSGEEQIVGTWIDGKPLYRRVFSEPISSEHSSDTAVVNALDSNCTVVNWKMWMANDSGNPTHYFDSWYNSSTYTYAWYKDSSKCIMYKNYGWKNSQLIYIYEYTKTTD